MTKTRDAAVAGAAVLPAEKKPRIENFFGGEVAFNTLVARTGKVAVLEADLHKKQLKTGEEEALKEEWESARLDQAFINLNAFSCAIEGKPLYDFLDLSDVPDETFSAVNTLFQSCLKEPSFLVAENETVPRALVRLAIALERVQHYDFLHQDTRADAMEWIDFANNLVQFINKKGLVDLSLRDFRLPQFKMVGEKQKSVLPFSIPECRERQIERQELDRECKLTLDFLRVLVEHPDQAPPANQGFSDFSFTVKVASRGVTPEETFHFRGLGAYFSFFADPDYPTRHDFNIDMRWTLNNTEERSRLYYLQCLKSYTDINFDPPPYLTELCMYLTNVVYGSYSREFLQKAPVQQRLGTDDFEALDVKDPMSSRALGSALETIRQEDGMAMRVSFFGGENGYAGVLADYENILRLQPREVLFSNQLLREKDLYTHFIHALERTYPAVVCALQNNPDLYPKDLTLTPHDTQLVRRLLHEDLSLDSSELTSESQYCLAISLVIVRCSDLKLRERSESNKNALPFIVEHLKQWEAKLAVLEAEFKEKFPSDYLSRLRVLVIDHFEPAPIARKESNASLLPVSHASWSDLPIVPASLFERAEAPDTHETQSELSKTQEMARTLFERVLALPRSLREAPDFVEFEGNPREYVDRQLRLPRYVASSTHDAFAGISLHLEEVQSQVEAAEKIARDPLVSYFKGQFDAEDLVDPRDFRFEYVITVVDETTGKPREVMRRNEDDYRLFLLKYATKIQSVVIRWDHTGESCSSGDYFADSERYKKRGYGPEFETLLRSELKEFVPQVTNEAELDAQRYECYGGPEAYNNVLRGLQSISDYADLAAVEKSEATRDQNRQVGIAIAYASYLALRRLKGLPMTGKRFAEDLVFDPQSKIPMPKTIGERSYFLELYKQGDGMPLREGDPEGLVHLKIAVCVARRNYIAYRLSIEDTQEGRETMQRWEDMIEKFRALLPGMPDLSPLLIKDFVGLAPEPESLPGSAPGVVAPLAFPPALESARSVETSPFGLVEKGVERSRDWYVRSFGALFTPLPPDMTAQKRRYDFHDVLKIYSSSLFTYAITAHDMIALEIEKNPSFDEDRKIELLRQCDVAAFIDYFVDEARRVQEAQYSALPGEMKNLYEVFARTAEFAAPWHFRLRAMDVCSQISEAEQNEVFKKIYTYMSKNVLLSLLAGISPEDQQRFQTLLTTQGTTAHEVDEFVETSTATTLNRLAENELEYFAHLQDRFVKEVMQKSASSVPSKV